MLIIINILSSAIIVKPHTHDQVSLDKYPLDKFYICPCVQHKWTSISLTRSLVQKLVTPAFEQGKSC